MAAFPLHFGRRYTGTTAAAEVGPEEGAGVRSLCFALMLLTPPWGKWELYRLFQEV